MPFSRTTKDEHTFKTLGDTPSAITANEYVRGNAGGTDLEFRSTSEVRSDIGAGTGTMSSFDVTGDSGDVDQTIADGNTLTIAGGDGITTAASNDDILTVTLDLTKDQAWTGSQRGTLVTTGILDDTTDPDEATFDMNAGNNFKVTLADATKLIFSNITDGQSGFIILVSGQTVTLDTAIKSPGGTGASDLTTAGTHLINYITDGTTVYITYGKAME